jgi:hypothetical protein
MADVTRLPEGVWIEGDLTTARPVDAVVRNTLDGALYVSDNALVPSYTLLGNAPAPDQLIFVNAKADLPAPVAGVITLPANTAWWLTTVVDLTGDRLVAGLNTTILGSSSEMCGLISTGLVGTALLSSDFTLPMRDIFFTADIALDLDGQGAATAFLIWSEVNFIDCGLAGTIANYENTVADRLQLRGSGALTFAGTHATIAITGSIIQPSTGVGATGIIIPATATISRRFRTSYSAFIAAAIGDTALDVDAAAISNAETFILDTVNFEGAGTFLGGADSTSSASLFTNNIGITNSSSVAHYFMLNNVTATLNGAEASGTPLKVAGATTDGLLVSHFDQQPDDNRATFTGALSQTYLISVTAALTSGNNQPIDICVSLNGAPVVSSIMRVTTGVAGRVESVATFGVVNLVTGSYFEIYVTNNDGTPANIIVTDMQVVARRLQ